MRASHPSNSVVPLADVRGFSGTWPKMFTSGHGAAIPGGQQLDCITTEDPGI